MKKRLLLFAVLIIACTIFTGCYRADYNVKINKNAKFKVTSRVLASKSYYETDSSNNISAKTVYKKLKKDIKKNHKNSKKTLKFKKIKKTIRGEKYYGYIVTGYKKSDFKDDFKTYKKNGRIYVEISMPDYSTFSDEDMTADDLSEMLGLMRMGGMSSKYSFTFPKKPKTTYGSVKGKTVTVDMMKYMQKHKNGGTIIISCKG